jgi:hypothetical protein
VAIFAGDIKLFDIVLKQAGTVGLGERQVGGTIENVLDTFTGVEIEIEDRRG